MQGCEGRSSNPVSVLFDQLNHPEADSGKEKPGLLEWRFRPDLKVDHLILGKGKPGGCWKSMDGDVQTVSLGTWMELPNLKMNPENEPGSSRVHVSQVAKYYQTYVKSMGLEAHFNKRTFTSRFILNDICKLS